MDRTPRFRARGTASREAFVATGRFDEALVTSAQEAQKLREAADYEALTPGTEEPASLLSDARRFVDAVNRMLGVSGPKA